MIVKSEWVGEIELTSDEEVIAAVPFNGYVLVFSSDGQVYKVETEEVDPVSSG